MFHILGDVHFASDVSACDDQLPHGPEHLLVDQQLHLPDPVQGGQVSSSQREAGYWGDDSMEA